MEQNEHQKSHKNCLPNLYSSVHGISFEGGSVSHEKSLKLDTYIWSSRLFKINFGESVLLHIFQYLVTKDSIVVIFHIINLILFFFNLRIVNGQDIHEVVSWILESTTLISYLPEIKGTFFGITLIDNMTV